MLTRHTFARLIPILTIASLLLIKTMLLPHMTSAQNTPFVADTLIPPRVFDFRADGWLSDFGFDSFSTICFVKHFDEQGNDYSFVVRHDDHGVIVDTLYLSASPPSRDEFFIFDAKGQAMALGFGPSLVDNSFFCQK